MAIDLSRPLSILVADDHAVVREGLKRLLESATGDWAVTEAADGFAALELLRCQAFDMAIFDLSMPGMGGLELLARVRLLHPKMPVLILTMRAEEHYARRAFEAGARAYITKDTAAQDLVAAVRKVAVGGVYVSSSLAEQMVMHLGAKAGSTPIDQLSDRELEVMRRLVAGQTPTEIAAALHLSIKTVSSHKSRIQAKLELPSLAALVRFGLEHGLGRRRRQAAGRAMTLQRYLARLIWWCVTPLLVLAIGLGYLHLRNTREDDGASARWMAQMLARGVEQMAAARLSGLQALASSPLVEDESRWPDLHREAQGFATAFGGAVSLVDSERRMRLHSAVPLGQALPPLTMPAGRSAIAEVFESGQPAVGDPFSSPISQEPMVALAVPVRREPRVGWVVASVVPLAQLDALLEGLTMPPGWTLALRDSTGQLIVQRSRGPESATGEAAAPSLRFVEQPTGVPWSVEVSVPSATRAWNLLGVAMELAVALLGVTLFSVIGALRSTRRLARSVRSLAAPAAQTPPSDEVDEIRETRRLLQDARLQREAAVDSLALREAQLRGIFDSASEAILTADPSQTIVLANPAAAQVFGRPVEQLVGLPLSDLVPERLRSQHRTHIDQFGLFDRGSRGTGHRRAVLALRADGREFPIEAALSQVETGGERLYTVIVRDITERVEAQAAIEASRARLKATLESMDDGLAIADTGHRIVEVNAALVRLYGFGGKADFLRPIVDFQDQLEMSTLDGRVLTPTQWTMPRALRGERGSGVELRVRHKDTGRQWIASFSFAPIRGADGEIAGAVFSVRDVTEQKRIADDLKASHLDLERLVASQNSVQEDERKRIARELHDELQQVLAAIKMDIASILPELTANPARLPALIQRMDELATAAITSSRRIVNDLRPPLLEEFGLAVALQQLAARFMVHTPVVVGVESDLARDPDGEPGHSVALCLYRVAQEALNNVAKHSGATQVQIRLALTPGRGWLLTIADNGRGLRPEDRHKPASFGLRGMAERVRALGGELTVEGQPGQGVVVTARVSAEGHRGSDRPVDREDHQRPA